MDLNLRIVLYQFCTKVVIIFVTKFGEASETQQKAFPRHIKFRETVVLMTYLAPVFRQKITHTKKTHTHTRRSLSPRLSLTHEQSHQFTTQPAPPQHHQPPELSSPDLFTDPSAV